jgi:small subunit ribosomal protein S8
MKNLTKISKTLSIILYYQKLNHKSVVVRNSIIIKIFLNFLIKEGLINGYKVQNDKIEIFLKYTRNGNSTFTVLKKISTNRKKESITLEKLSLLNKQLGIYILSTNKGLLTDAEAINKIISGTLLYYIR